MPQLLLLSSPIPLASVAGAMAGEAEDVVDAEVEVEVEDGLVGTRTHPNHRRRGSGRKRKKRS